MDRDIELESAFDIICDRFKLTKQELIKILDKRDNLDCNSRPIANLFDGDKNYTISFLNWIDEVGDKYLLDWIDKHQNSIGEIPPKQIVKALNDLRRFRPHFEDGNKPSGPKPNWRDDCVFYDKVQILRKEGAKSNSEAFDRLGINAAEETLKKKWQRGRALSILWIAFMVG